MKSCWFPLFGVFLSQKASDCDKGYENVMFNLLILCWEVWEDILERYHSVWFVLLNNKKTPIKPKFISGWHYFCLNTNKRDLIVFFGGNKSLLPKPDFCFCGTQSRGRTVGERKRFVLCFYPFFVFWDLFSLSCWHSQERVSVALTCAL